MSHPPKGRSPYSLPPQAPQAQQNHDGCLSVPFCLSLDNQPQR
ncbi:MAG: hypothetical protein VKJ86_08920 [Synechococcus sp.]|nr:hypothetical protein [Synechococcus sp.]